MDRITKSLLEEFVSENGLDSLPLRVARTRSAPSILQPPSALQLPAISPISVTKLAFR
jgi:hypothetical protein